MAPEDVHPQVKDAVRAWARAKDADVGAKSLRTARAGLSAELVSQLVSELADISAELMITMLAREDGLEAEAEAVEVSGVMLHPQQAARLAAWAEDQKRTAEALGQTPEAWMRRVEAAFTAYGRRERGDAPGEEGSAELHETAKKLLGGVGEQFQNRPDVGSSATAGLRGILGARSFQKKK